jgi:NADH:ubiquinone oxidoreductase subunit 2 (subunit N)
MGMALASTPVAALALASTALLAVATLLAVRARAASQSFSWIVVAGAAYAVLGMAAALHVRESDGVRASVLQLLAVVLASAVAMLCSTTSEGEKITGGKLATAGRVLAWFTLVGLPPTVGFHSKVMVYRALLMAGWGWLAVVAMVTSAAALLPAFRGMVSSGGVEMRGLRAAGAVAVMAAIVLLGVYPQLGFAIARVVESLAS